MNLLSLIKNCRVDPVLKDLGEFKLLVGWQRKPGSRKANDRRGRPIVWDVEPRPWQAPRAVQNLTEGAKRVHAERKRQVSGEGYDAAHDDAHTDSSLAQVGACYVAAATLLDKGFSPEKAAALGGPEMFGRMWPKSWGVEWWKPGADPVRCHEKAGALFWAEADRLKRIHEVGAQFVRLLDLVDGQALAIDRILAARKIEEEKAALRESVIGGAK